jgi:hypothetical protein
MNRLPLTTLRELTMLQIMNALTDKPGWEEKVCCGHVLIPILAVLRSYHKCV